MSDKGERTDAPTEPTPPRVRKHEHEGKLVGVRGKRAIYRVTDGKRALLTSTLGILGEPIVALAQDELDAIPMAAN